MENLVIGNTSQLSHYFPDDYIKISSRNIDEELYKDTYFDRVYLCFADQRTYLNKKQPFFDINVDYTLRVVDMFYERSNKVILYGTSELWNNHNGKIDLSMDYNHNNHNYVKSKEMMCNIVKKIYDNVIIVHPFNFNSIYRTGDFLFTKIFDSIVNEKKIEIGNTHFYRDMIHPRYVVEQSIIAEKDIIVGSGRLVFVNDFIRSLYSYFSMDYNDFVTEKYNSEHKKMYYLNSNKCLYNNIYNDTIRDIENVKKIKYNGHLKIK